MASSESEPEFEVQEILRQRKRKGLVEYLVRWNGYNDSDDDSWEPASSLTNCVDQLKKFAQAQELIKKEKKRLSRARSKSRGRSVSRARSKSASRKSEKKKYVPKGEKSVLKSVAKDEKSRSDKSETNSKVLSSDEEDDEPLPSTRSRQSRRSEVVTTRQQTTDLKVRSDIVDGSMTKITRLLGERRETVENHRNIDPKVTKSTSMSCFWDNVWNNMDTAVLILFVCITVIIFSLILEKYISSDDISTSIAKIYKRSSKNIQNWWKILCAALCNGWNSIVVVVQSNGKKVSEK